MDLILVDRDGDRWTYNAANGRWRLECSLPGCGCAADEHALQYLADTFGPLDFAQPRLNYISLTLPTRIPLPR